MPAILFVVGEYVFAIAASSVAEIQIAKETDCCTSGRAGTVSKTLLHDTKHYWVVDAHEYFSLSSTRSTRLLLLVDTPVALKVDSIMQMTILPKVLPLPLAFQGDDRNRYSGLALLEGRAIPVVNPASFLSAEGLCELESDLLLNTQLGLEVAGAAR